jgi:hypothetical protein
MKRAALGVLILSLVAFPTFAGSATAHRMPVTTARCVSLEHIPGAWRMQIRCDQGQGSIILSDSATRKYRGDGMFAGLSQEEMQAVYQSLIPNEDSHFVIMQLG